MEYPKAKCEICGKVFTGETAEILAGKCKESHVKVIISIWDYELPKFISFFNTYDRDLLPKDFLKKLRNLQGRVLRGG